MQTGRRMCGTGRRGRLGGGAALLAILVSACAPGGGADSRGGASGSTAAGQIAIRGMLVDADGSPQVGVAVEARAMAPAGIVAAASGFQTYLARTDARGAFQLAVAAADVLGPYGGRFFEVRLAPLGPGADAPARVRVDAFVDGAGADLGTLRLWTGAVRAEADASGVDVDWQPLSDTHGLGATGYGVELRDSAGQVAATAQVSGFSNTYQATGAGTAQSAATASVTAFARISVGARTAYVAFRANEVAVAPGSGGHAR